ncbi:MAG: MFS transporter, partial [Proteobacteria bacterium]|nr:MFS transporter [Pseudomonadota bacterium]
LNYADRYLFAGLAQVMKREFVLSDGTLGLLLGPAFALLYTILGVPAARLADRTSWIAVACAGCLMWSLFTLSTALATSTATLALARVGVGIGEAAYQAPVAALIAAYFPLHQRGRAFAALMSAIYIGQIAGIAGGPAMAAMAGWRAPFVALGGAGVIAAGLALALVRDPRHEARPPAVEGLGRLALRLGRTPCWRQLTFGFSLGSFAGLAFGLWGTVLFERAFHLSTKASGAAFGVPFGFSGLIGTLGFGVIADRLARTRGPGAPLLLSGAALGVATLCTLAITWVPSLALAQLLALPSGLLGGGWSIGAMAAFQHLLPERYRAAGTALALLVIGLIANVGAPWSVGLLSQSFGEGLAGLRMALSLLIPTGVLGAFLLARAAGSLVADQARLADES